MNRDLPSQAVGGYVSMCTLYLTSGRVEGGWVEAREMMPLCVMSLFLSFSLPPSLSLPLSFPQYLGCIEVRQSMRTLQYTMRTQVTK